MDYIKVADDLRFSRVIAGFMRAADAKMEPGDLLRFTQECLDMGITTMDHADIYGNYQCEKLFGEAVLKQMPELRDQMQIVTKCDIVLPGRSESGSIYYTAEPEHIIHSVERSLKNLHTDHVDVLLLHRPDYLMHPEKTAGALEKLQKEGKVRYFGVSNCLPLQFDMLNSYLSTPLVTNQIHISPASLEAFDNGSIDHALLRRIPLMAWSPLDGGQILRDSSPASLRLREKLEQIAEQHNVDEITKVMYAWLYQIPARVCAVTGSMKIKHVEAAVEACSLTLSHAEWYAILEASRGYPVP